MAENQTTEGPGPEKSAELLLRGEIARITYRDAESGFSVVRLEPEGQGRSGQRPQGETLVGVLPPTIRVGTHVVARGSWQTHPRFGRQFKARSVTESEPTSVEGILRYLSSGAVRGLGPVLAGRIVETFGERSLEIFEKFPEKLQEVPGIGAKKLAEICEAWAEKRNLREVILFFQQHEVPIGLAHRIYNTYGTRAIEVVRENPYLLTKDVWGIGFQTADKIAQALGLDPASDARLRGALIYVLRRAAESGHCYLPQEVLVEKTSSLIDVADGELIGQALARAALEGEFILAGGRVYPHLLYRAETDLAKRLASRLSSMWEPEPFIPGALIEAAANQQQSVVTANAGGRLSAITLSEEQKKALELAATKPLTVITGGPGCGKTTVLKTIAQLFRMGGLRIRLAAPTGRAAQRLSEVCETEASTIHRLLKFDPVNRNFLHDANDPLPLDALIVDESSMIDLPLASSLFQAVPDSARIVIVGDADQLPSVGPGLFLADLLAIPQVPRVALTKLFRRADESAITFIAHEINSAIVPEIPSPDGQRKSDAYLLPVQNTTEGAELIERLVVDQVPKKFGFRSNEITVLSPMNNGEMGVVALNKRLQERLVPYLPGVPRVMVGGLEFRLGDRVCQRVNNYQLGTNGVFNGDQGTIIGIDDQGEKVLVRLWDGREVEYAAEYLPQLDLAYAITIHRSQGSEVPAIILALHDSHSILLERQLIYTAVTRAKKLLIIVGSKRALVIATKRIRSKRRYTGLVPSTTELLEQT